MTAAVAGKEERTNLSWQQLIEFRFLNGIEIFSLAGWGMMFHCIEAVSVFEGGGCQMPGDTDKVTNDAEVRIIGKPWGELQTMWIFNK